MRFLVDACAGQTIADTLHGQGHEVVFVGAVDPKMKDDLILEWAVREQQIVVTTDKDFEEMVYRQGKPHVWALCGWPTYVFPGAFPSCKRHSSVMEQIWDLG